MAAAPPPPPPLQQQAPAASEFSHESIPAPVLKARVLPPDARRLSLGFSLNNRRQSGMGLPSGRASISHAHLPPPLDRRAAAAPAPAPPALQPQQQPHAAPSGAAAGASAAAPAQHAALHAAPHAAASSAHAQSPLPPSPLLSSLRPLAPAPQPAPFRIAVDDGESVDGGTASSVDSAEEGEGGAAAGGSNENAAPRAAQAGGASGASSRAVLGSAAGYEGSGGSAALFGSAGAYGGCEDVGSLRHPRHPANSFTFAVDPEFQGNGAEAHSARAVFR